MFAEWHLYDDLYGDVYDEMCDDLYEDLYDDMYDLYDDLYDKALAYVFAGHHRILYDTATVTHRHLKGMFSTQTITGRS